MNKIIDTERNKILVDKDGEPICEGQLVTDFRGEEAIVHGGRAGWGASEGRICVKEKNSNIESEYYPSVYECKWVDLE